MESHNIPGAGTSRRSARLPRRCPAARSKLGKAGSRHAEFWRSSLRDYTFPKIGHKRVNQITTADVMSILLPIWNEKRSTAQRVRQRTGAVMEWAVAQGYREGNPPGDAISAALPRKRKAGRSTTGHCLTPALARRSARCAGLGPCPLRSWPWNYWR